MDYVILNDPDDILQREIYIFDSNITFALKYLLKCYSSAGQVSTQVQYGLAMLNVRMKYQM